MSILERSPLPPAPAAGPTPRSDRLRVITAGHVGNMEARLGASGFDVIAIAETEDALIHAVSEDEPDAIVVEADLCDSLEHVRELAPDAVLIVVGDHTPVGALGRIEQGVSGTVMAGLLHALVTEGVGAAVAWGVVPAFGPGPGLSVSQRLGGWLLSTKADVPRAPLVSTLREHADLVTAAVTVAVTVSAGLVLASGPPRRHERPAPVQAPAAVPAPAHPVVDSFPTTPGPAHVPSTPSTANGSLRDEGESGNRVGPNRGTSGHHGRYDHPPADATRPPGVAHGWDHRPPKHEDNGRHTGWDRNSVPGDLPPGRNSGHGGHPGNSSAHGGNSGGNSGLGGNSGGNSAHGGGSSSGHGGNSGGNSAHGGGSSSGNGGHPTSGSGHGGNSGGNPGHGGPPE